MEEIILEAQIRKDSGTGRVNRLRKQAIIPAVVYGEGRKTLTIQVRSKDFVNLMSAHHGESFVLNLRIKEDLKNEDKAVLIKQVQHNPVTDDIVHIDFNEISLTKKIRVKVPVAAKGESVGVRQDGGVLDHVLWEIEVECLPTQIPKSVEVDVTALKVGDSIHVRNLVIPQGLKVFNDPEATVLAVVAPIKEEAAPTVEEALAAGAKAEPEVIKEKKEKAEGAEGASAKTAPGEKK
ncbi:MAG: hypothetical protein A2Y42_03075 [Omnitrophica WOR_2 bacterium GWB2_45_9]|nr:MAG: hypothetical protein A2Y42_03075 [Omnitrophica WOR_2 bacterium GWB2_45_9]OGX45985.1 MAG: hypothetical protein A2216_00090 [Omnitrophica WOR_2 bacterium RIFOXYA2_FULL_45_12]OGX61299.1 MAG: hypothetical protein A2471_04510 [Omnitrophica WOR_2 bacterium RIFOXYC2_FULL_45_15]